MLIAGDFQLFPIRTYYDYGKLTGASVTFTRTYIAQPLKIEVTRVSQQCCGGPAITWNAAKRYFGNCDGLPAPQSFSDTLIMRNIGTLVSTTAYLGTDAPKWHRNHPRICE